MQTIGDRRYSVFSDDRGHFAFPFGSLPRGSGTLLVGKFQAPVSYAGAPVKDLKLSVPQSFLPGGRRKE